jgi:translation initiation factor 3 subunit J
MSDDWDQSSDEDAKKTTAPTARKPPVPVKSSKFAGEDEEEDGPASDWDAESSEEEAKPAKPAPAAAAPPKKKGTLKAKLAEKEAAKKAAADEDEGDYDEDAVLNPRDRAKRDKERELKSDMDNAAALFGQSSGAAKDAPALFSMNPKSKDEFLEFSKQIMEQLILRHKDKPLYATFVEAHVRALSEPLRDVDVRKAATGLTTLANEKQKEARDKASGKKKGAGKKPVLGGAKTITKVDTGAYEEALDDFGDDDFM